ncbi:hypothetical protein D3C79_739610 [compost metagenome]
MQGQRFAHTGAVIAVTHENERHPWPFGAHLAQQVEAVDTGQLAGSDDQVRLAGQGTERLRAVSAYLQAGVTAHAEQHLAEHVPYPRIAFDNQYAWWGGGCSAHHQLLLNTLTHSPSQLPKPVLR